MTDTQHGDILDLAKRWLRLRVIARDIEAAWQAENWRRAGAIAEYSGVELDVRVTEREDR